MSASASQYHALILVVDDHEDAREMYCAGLRFDGFECLEAQDGAAALKQARERRPDLVVMDISMPRMDGLQAVEEMKRDPELRAIPVMMLTALDFDEQRTRAAALGAEGFIAKPILPEDLVQAVRHRLKIA